LNAYEFREGTGLLEEDKQASDKPKPFNLTIKQKKKCKTSKEASSEPGLVEKAQELTER